MPTTHPDYTYTPPVITATNLPKEALLHPEFGIIGHSDMAKLRKSYPPTKFANFTNRILRLVPAANVDARYANGSGVDSRYYVVISFPKTTSEQTPGTDLSGLSVSPPHHRLFARDQ
jgi:hypothetical protein